jgi:hemerythrin-like domain-containing protein
MEPPHEADDRITAFGTHLITVHGWLRDELDTLRENVDAYLDGGARPKELQTHCLAFCSLVHGHHTGEDTSVFPALAQEFPELGPAIEQLERDHHVVADILQRLEGLVAGLGDDGDRQPPEPQLLRGEVEGLAALLENHFAYEERKLVAALNSLS